MNLDHMRIWVDALYNDTDGQCVGELVDMRGCHCVIGVGVVASGQQASYYDPQHEQIYKFYDWLECPPYGVMVRFGGTERRANVFTLNDSWRWPLADIARVLEAEYLTPAGM